MLRDGQILLPSIARAEGGLTRFAPSFSVAADVRSGSETEVMAQRRDVRFAANRRHSPNTARRQKLR
jgi:hypothetical protein